MTDFENILKVGDMKRDGKKNQEIARAIHPRKYAKNPESAIKLVAHYNSRAVWDQHPFDPALGESVPASRSRRA